MFKKVLSTILVLLIVVCALPFSVLAYETQGFEVESEAAILVSLDTGDVLYEKRADERRFPASVTKIMTGVLLTEHCDDYSQVRTVTKENVESLFGSDLTVAGFVEGEKVTLEQCLNLLMVCSSADAANVIADYVEGKTGKDFVDLMNEKAKALGMNDTNYVNSTGLHDENHYTTINDLVKLCKYAVEVPKFLDICSQATYTLPKTNKHNECTYVTTNFMINRYTNFYYEYVRGIKTGFTTPAGRCVASTASKDGYNYLCIVMGGDNYKRTEFSDSINLYKWAFEDFTYKTVADTTAIIDEMKVERSTETDFVQLYPEKNVTVIMPKSIESDSIIYDVVLKENSVVAPVEKGQVLGYVSIKCAGKEIAKVNLVSNTEIKDSLGLQILQITKNIFSNVLFILLFVVILCVAIALIVIVAIHNKNKRKRLSKIRKMNRQNRFKGE